MAQPSNTSGCDFFVTIESFLIEHGSALLLPLAVIEGPIVSIVAGFLSARGYFDWRLALGLLVCGDLIGDLTYYLAGRTSVRPLRMLGRHFGLRSAPSPELRSKLASNATKMLFIGKWTHSIGFLVLIGSGMLRLPLPRFMLINLVATLPKSALLFGIGFFGARYIPLFEQHMLLTTILLCVAGGTAILVVVRRAGLVRADR
jgi:membrane protein DedA with SNARE-associated domain